MTAPSLDAPALNFESWIGNRKSELPDTVLAYMCEAFYAGMFPALQAASAAHVPEPPALDAAEIARQLRLVISVECSPGEYVHRIANQAADLLAAQAKHLVELERTLFDAQQAIIKEGLARDSAEQRLATEHAEDFAACREMAAKVAEGTLGWSEAGDTRAQTIAAAIRALIAPDETENHK